jgi:hypothetical protein
MQLMTLLSQKRPISTPWFVYDSDEGISFNFPHGIPPHLSPIFPAPPSFSFT